MERIVKWKLSKVDKTPQDKVSHIDIEGSDVGGGITVYKTDSGTFAVLKACSYKLPSGRKVPGAGFTYMDQLVGFVNPRTYVFKSISMNGAIENAIKDGRHVYSFENFKHFMNNKDKLLTPTN